MLLSKTLRSSTFRLAILYVCLFGAGVAGLFGYVYWSTTKYVKHRYDSIIISERGEQLNIFAQSGREGLARALKSRSESIPVDSDVYLLADADYAPIAGNLKDWPLAAHAGDGWIEFAPPPDWQPNAKHRPLLRALLTTLPDGSHLLSGEDTHDMVAFARTINRGLAIGVLLFCLLAGGAGLSVTRRTVARIEAVNATSRAIMASGLGKRIPTRGTKDEWDQLAQNLNSMLERIEGLVRGIKEVSDNIAHDLRTPLMRMRGRLEVALRAQRNGLADEALIARTVTELDEVLKTFSSLLRISAVEARERTVGFGSVELGKLAAEVTDLFDAAAEERGIHLRCTVSSVPPVLGDRDLLFETLSNLIDNALKHGQSDIEVRVEPDGLTGVRLKVRDHGPGIPAAERKNVLQRFYRLERSRTTPGNGLGLSLVQAVAQLHGAELALVDAAPGLSVEIKFPALATAEARPGAAPVHAPQVAAELGAQATRPV
ncbi:MAG TPA: HAMP domain-containing sensor histidine kinase [Stellaceae bacterium]|nr:HAMP domain-containing sensor histidine kinase [Stellaceae bacterium]